MIIGDKSLFAIEFHHTSDVVPQAFGSICYWVNNEPYGDIEQCSTLGLLSSVREFYSLEQKVSIKKDLLNHKLVYDDIQDILYQVHHDTSLKDFLYSYHPITIEASEAFDGSEVFLLKDVKDNVWIVAADIIAKRHSFSPIREERVKAVFEQFLTILHKVSL